ncbi:MAG: phage tail tape measure protein [Nitratireductor sp.]|nr:phage tail tape measure protein [Nitratireductor sp.]
MSTLTAQLVVSLVDRATAPARAVAQSVGRLRDMQMANAKAMAATRAQMLDAVAMAYMLKRAITAPINAAIEFESAMADVRKVVDFDEPDGLEKLGDQILEMSQRLPMAAKDIAAIVAAAGQAGMAGDELTEFAELAVKVGVAFDMTAEQTGEALAKIKTALGLTVAETGALADAINYLSNTSASSAPDLIDFMRRVGSVGKQYGFTAEQTAAFGSAMIAAGAEANVAATSFRNMGKALVKGEAATKAQRTAFKKLGLDARKVAADMQKDAVGTTMRVIEAIRKLPEEVQASTISQLFGDEARAIAPLIDNAQLLEQALGSVADKASYLGSATEEFERVASTTKYQLQALRNRFEALGIAIGSALLPGLNRLMEVIGPIVGAITGVARASPHATAAIVALTAGLVGLRIATLAARYAFLFMKGGAIDAAIGVAKGAGLIVGAMKQIRLAILGATMLSAVGGGGIFAGIVSGIVSVVGAIAGAATAITAPIAAIILAVAGVALAIYNYWEPISNFVSGFAEIIGSALASIAGALGSWAKQKIVDIAGALGLDPAAVSASIDSIVAMASALPGKILAGIKSAAGGIGSWLSEIFTMNDYSAEAEAGFRDAGRRLAQALLDGIKSLTGSILGFVGGLASSAAAKAKSAVATVRGYLSGGSTASPGVDGARAAGGPIVAGRTYLTGEHGPELITAARNGYVHDAQSTARMAAGGRAGAPSYQISVGDIIVQGVRDPAAAARQIAEQLGGELKEALRGLQADTEWSVA